LINQYVRVIYYQRFSEVYSNLMSYELTSFAQKNGTETAVARVNQNRDFHHETLADCVIFVRISVSVTVCRTLFTPELTAN